MATHTTNYNLSKPESTDTQSSFISDYCDNMDIIDQNLGGGGGGNVYGAFIDPNRVLANGTFSGSLTYTATEDSCAVVGIVSDNSSIGNIYIDGVVYTSLYNVGGSSVYQNATVYLRKGQVMTVSEGNGAWTVSYTVYGLIQGTDGIFAPVIYSDTERKIGVWRDNKPLYAKTYHFTSGWVNDSWTDITDLSGLNIDTFVKSDFSVSRTDNSLQYTGNGSIRPETSGQNHTISARYYSNHLQVMVNNYNDIVRLDITIFYTKTTDSAGSGNWNTDGIPMHHYSTNEQVIGTWIDGKPLYECTVDGLSLPVNLSWTSEVATNLNIKYLVNATLYDNSNPTNPVLVNVEQVQVLNGGFRISHSNNSGRTITRAVIQYTKTTD